MSDNLITLSIQIITETNHHSNIKTNHKELIKTKFYLHLNQLISLNQMRHTDKAKTKLNFHILMSFSTTLLSHDTVIHSICVIHAEWFSKTAKVFKITL